MRSPLYIILSLVIFHANLIGKHESNFTAHGNSEEDPSDPAAEEPSQSAGRPWTAAERLQRMQDGPRGSLRGPVPPGAVKRP